MNERDETLLEDLTETIKKGKEKGETETEQTEYEEKWAKLQMKKDEMKNTKYRLKYDSILSEIANQLVDTENKNYSPSASNTPNHNLIFYPTSQGGGGIDYIPQLVKKTASQTTSVPQVKKPFAFSKINIATSLLGTRVPDGNFESDDKLLAMTYYELWRKTWLNDEGNGQSAFQSTTQNTCTTGFGAMKTIYKQVNQPVKSGDCTVQRVRFDDIYRVSMDPARLWVGVGYKNSDYWSRVEYLYEEDIKYEDFKFMMKKAGIEDMDEKKINFVKSSLSPEGAEEDTKKKSTHVTITYYENELTNTYLIMCGPYCLYDGELTSPDGYASISTANFLVDNDRNPYGVGLWELCRGSESLMNHLMFMNAQQVEAEISPIIFASQIGMANGQIQRGPNNINPKTPGTEIDVVRTTGNPSASMGLVANESNILDGIIGITDVVAGLGSEATLGGTVIAKEAALQRLSVPRNSLVSMIRREAYVACSYFKYYYGNSRFASFKTQDALQKFRELNPSYFVEPVERLDGSLVGLFSKKVSLPFLANIDSTHPDGYTLEENTPATYSRKELMARVHTISDQSPLSKEILITIDPSSMLQPSEEITQQKVTGLLPMIQQMTLQAIQMAQQDPMLGKALMKQLIAYMEVMKLDLYKWMPKEIIDPILAGEIVDPQMQQLAIANRMGAIQEQMDKTGIPVQKDINNLPQTQNSMQDAFNASVGKLK